MNVRANHAVWLVVLGALAASGIRPRTDQLPAGPAQVTPSDDVTLRVIVVDSAEKAQGIVARLNGGENFVAVAQAESIDPTGGTGGLLGKVALSTLPPVLKDALVGVGPGQLSPVVQIPTGFAILKVVDDTDPANINMNAAVSGHLHTGHTHEREICDRCERTRRSGGAPAGVSQTSRLEPGSPHDLPGASRVFGVVAEVARRFPVA